jgi:hypothetical protein
MNNLDSKSNALFSPSLDKHEKIGFYENNEKVYTMNFCLLKPLPPYKKQKSGTECAFILIFLVFRHASI